MLSLIAFSFLLTKIDRQSDCSGWRFLVVQFLILLKIRPLSFSVAVPIQGLPTARTVGHKFPVQQFLASGTTVVNIILVENNSIFYPHGNTVRQHQLKTDRKISQSAGPCPLSDYHDLCSFFCVVFSIMRLWHCFWGLYFMDISSPPLMQKHKRSGNISDKTLPLNILYMCLCGKK